VIQDNTFKTLNNARMALVLVDNDGDSLGISIQKGLQASGFFTIDQYIAGEKATAARANEAVANGVYQVGVIVPDGATRHIRSKAREITAGMFAEKDSTITSASPASEIIIYFDPVTKNTFKNSIVSSLEKFISEIELRFFMESFSAEMKQLMPDFHAPDIKTLKNIRLHEKYATSKDNKIIPNSVQHNVPAWTMFAMFFIVIPLAGNIINEKDYGTELRLRTMPVSYLTIFSGKLVTYLIVCIIQFLLMMSVGLVFLPMLGLPMLSIGNSIAGLTLIVLSSGLAATGYGIMIGALSGTREQAASFGSISVMILAAIGGIWVPVFAMPAFMKTLSSFSPLNWGLNGFYEIFLRNGDVLTVLPDAMRLLAFFVVSLSIAYWFNLYKNRLT
jgi:ABC-2 type transport system permease protein